MSELTMNERNVYLYWVGAEYKLTSILRNLIYLHSTNGKGYKVNLITKDNLHKYINNLPGYFNNLALTHQVDYIRVNVMCDNGGIWLESNNLVLENLDTLFDILQEKDGFFIKGSDNNVINCVFGSKQNTPLLTKWKELTNHTLFNMTSDKAESSILKTIIEKYPEYYCNYTVFNGLDTMCPVNWDKCCMEFLETPYDNYKNYIRHYQPLLILENKVSDALENKSEKEILSGAIPLNYFINKSIENMKLVDYDFVEIGTSNFDTLIQSCNDNTKGISVDAVKYYIDVLPNKENCIKLNVGISNVNDTLNVYYIPEESIKKYNLPNWFKGCNCINNFHPLHIKHNVTHLCKIDQVKVITPCELFYQNKVKTVGFLKIDTEGHDCIILNALYSYIKYLPNSFYPRKILFETNEHSKAIIVDEIISLYTSLGYTLQSRGYDTVLIFSV